ncbi:hypothetical protein [Cesiribacter andamanensis]|nr:hypothetical protein [Cesiribacter andamanensis]
MIKFVGGPLAGAATNLGYLETVALTTMGMMTTVLLFTLMGPRLRRGISQRLRGNRPAFSQKNRRFVKIWQRWGVFGVSFLTPLILTPILGALLANAFSHNRQKILLYMLGSALFWGLLLSGLVLSARQALL